MKLQTNSDVKNWLTTRLESTNRSLITGEPHLSRDYLQGMRYAYEKMAESFGFEIISEVKLK